MISDIFSIWGWLYRCWLLIGFFVFSLMAVASALDTKKIPHIDFLISLA